MKALLKHILINLLVIYLVDVSYPGFTILHNLKILFSAAVIWLILNKIVRPVIKLLLLPINLITLNLFSWVIGLITLFLLQVLVGDVKILPFQFTGLNYNGFTVPPFYINLFLSYVITSTLFNLYHSLIIWLIRKDSE